MIRSKSCRVDPVIAHTASLTYSGYAPVLSTSYTPMPTGRFATTSFTCCDRCSSSASLRCVTSLLQHSTVASDMRKNVVSNHTVRSSVTHRQVTVVVLSAMPLR